jgi:parallel beta-helix repeat protein
MKRECVHCAAVITLSLLLCFSAAFVSPRVELHISKFDGVRSSPIAPFIIAENLTEIEYLGINGNEELLQLADEYNWPGTGKEWDPIIIDGYYFRNAVHNFVVDNTDLYWEFRNNILDGIDGSYCQIVIGNLKNARIAHNIFIRGAVGIHTIRVTDCQFTANTMYNITWDGVLMEKSHRNIISFNKFYDHGDSGVHAWDLCNDNNIMYNEVYDSTYGIMLWEGSNSNTIQYNKIHHVSSLGLDIQTDDNVVFGNRIHHTGDDGICISGTGCEVERNLVYNTSGYGVHLYSTGGDALIENNVLINNAFGGIQLHHSGNSRIANNDIIDNGLLQAWDYGEGNVFVHNYWHEWIGNDTNNDSIIDVPKVIHGSTENTDSRPALNPINTLPSWYEFVPITGPPPPEPDPTTTTTPTSSLTSPSTTLTDSITGSPSSQESGLSVLVLSATSGIAVLVIIGVLGRRIRNQN